MEQGSMNSAHFCATVDRYLVAALALIAVFCIADLAVRGWRQGLPKRTADEPMWRWVLSLLRPTTLLWALPFAGIIAFLDNWCALGLYSGSSYVLEHCCKTALICCACTLPRNLICSLLDTLARRIGAIKATEDIPRAEHLAGTQTRLWACIPYRLLHIALTVGLLWYAATTAAPLIELPWNDLASSIDPSFVQLELMLVAMAVVFAYFLFQQHGAGPALVVAFCLVIGIAQYFVALFKGAVIQPADLLALGTAAEVSEGYEFVLNTLCVRAIEQACLALLACSYVIPVYHARHDIPLWRRRGVVCSVLACLSLAALMWNVTVPDWREDYGVTITYWTTLNGPRTFGFLPSFITAVQDLEIEEPEGYSAESAAKLEADYASQWEQTYAADETRQAAEAQFDETQPSVIVVMNESFSDLSSIQCIADAGYTGPTFLKSGMNDALASGMLDVSVLGGGTCNSEFEMLTGISMAFIGPGKYPYSFYNFSGIDTLVGQFADLGYQTTAIHPNAADNWQRNRTYAAMGFDEFLSIDDFDENAERLHLGIRDSVTYDKVLEVLASSDEPQFIFDVTMQNHGGYGTGTTPENYLVDCRPNGEGNDDELVEYLSCINAADQDLQAFVEQLRSLDRPVILVFFGDHQPALSTGYAEISYGAEDELTRTERQYQTRYVIWANYDVAGSTTQLTHDIACSELSSTMLQITGAPMSDYQKAQIVSRESLPAFNALGWQDTDGTWHELTDRDGEAGQALSDLETLSYYEFGSKV